MFLIGVYTKEQAEEIGFSKLNKIAAICEASQVDGGSRSVELVGQRFTVADDFGVVMEVQLDANTIYFVDIEARQVVPLRGTWSMEDFSSAERMKLLARNIVRENIDLIRRR